MSLPKQSPLSLFTNQIKQLVDALCIAYPDDSDILSVSKSFKLAHLANKRLILKLFRTYLKPYKKMVFENDEKFFLNNTYEKECGELTDSAEKKEEAFGFVVQLKKKWGDMDAKTKKNIWKHLEAIFIRESRCS